MIGIWFPISQGKFALVDRDLYEEISKTKWSTAYDNAAIVFHGQYAVLNCSWLGERC